MYNSKLVGNDCELYVLALAISLCYKDVPPLIFYGQLSLRDHHVKCIEANEIQPFKRESTRNASKLVDLWLD